MTPALLEASHRRKNQLTGEWVLVSPHRTKRPWKGKVEARPAIDRPFHDPHCQLCPNGKRSNGEVNPAYASTFVFTNDFPALMNSSPKHETVSNGLFQSEMASGECRVICFSPRHDLTLPEMETENIQKVIDLWISQWKELSKKFLWTQIFENKGEIMGCSNPHPHGQIWASNYLPTEIDKEDRRQQAYWVESGQNLLIDYAQSEVNSGERIVWMNKHWVVLVPFWATWPYETMILPRKRHIPQFSDLTKDEIFFLAEAMQNLLIRYDNLFETSFPYSMGWHCAPAVKSHRAFWQLHAHYYPTLLRSATIQKFMVGYEMLAEAQRDLTPEQAAEKLRSLSTLHYKQSRTLQFS